MRVTRTTNTNSVNWGASGDSRLIGGIGVEIASIENGQILVYRDEDQKFAKALGLDREKILSSERQRETQERAQKKAMDDYLKEPTKKIKNSFASWESPTVC